MRRETVTIAPRFNGPPTSGNGGYVCGLLASTISGPSEATLRAPPPLGKALTLSSDGVNATLHDGDVLLGEAKAAPGFALEAPTPPSFEEARAAAARYRGHTDHRFPTCFVCGPARKDGLDIFTGPVASRAGIVACTWTPSADLADENGAVREAFIHAALDCPSYWALPRAGEMMALLARLTAHVHALPRVGDQLIVAAWPIGADGRKHRGGSAVCSANGVIAVAEALWIEPKSL